MQHQIETQLNTPVNGFKNQTMNNWLYERNKLLITYCELAGISANENKESALPQADYIKYFCQILMDYISAGHFEIFEQLMNDQSLEEKNHHYEEGLSESRQLNVQLILPEILVSTDLALQFNDKYAENISEKHLKSFDNNLSTLGTHLEQRFELEDSLIRALQKH